MRLVSLSPSPWGLFLGILCVSAAPVAAQRTWIVDWYGSGDFTDLPPAVAAAAPGDTIVVANPDTNQYTTPVISKGITLMQSYNYFTVVDVRVRNLPAGERFALVGWGGVFNLDFAHCDGQVVLDRVDMFRPFDRSRRSLVIDDCDHVTINASGVYDVQIADSRVVFGRSGMFGFASFDGTVATAGVTMTNSVVSIADCFVQGETYLASNSAPSPRSGIEMQGGRLVVTGRAGYAYVQGGAACCDVSVNPPRVVYGSAVRSDGGDVVVDPDVFLAPQSGVPTEGSSTFSTTEVAFLRQVTLPHPAAGALETDLYATPGVSAIVCVSLPVPPLSTVFGDLWLDPVGLLVVTSGTTDGAGRMHRVFPGLNATIVRGATFAWQGIYLENGALKLSEPATTIMWSH